MSKHQTQQTVDAEFVGDISLANRLRAQRTAIAKESARKIRKIDNALALLESTEAESVVAQAQEVLGELEG